MSWDFQAFVISWVLSRSAHRIVAAGMERMTAAYPPHSHPYPSWNSIFFNGFHHVFGAGGIKAAGGRQERRDKLLIAAKHGHYCSLHRINTRAVSRHRSGKDASRTERRGLNTMNRLGRSKKSWDRAAARIRRLMRLRTTALPKARGTVKPTFAGSSGSPTRWRQNAAK